MTGPTAGDLIELADTGLVIRIEADAQRAGDEFRTGFGKTARDGMHLRAATAAETCDIVITNVTLLDPVLGIRTVSVGVRAGRISAIGRAGNPDTLDGVDVVVGTGTTIIPGDGLLATPGAVDTHVHLLSPRVLEASFSGVRSERPCGRPTLSQAPLARGSSSDPRPLVEGLAAGGACGFKVHEDLGAHPRCLDTALTVADTLAVAGGADLPRLPRRGLRRRARPERAGTGRPGGNVVASSTERPRCRSGRDAVAEGTWGHRSRWCTAWTRPGTVRRTGPGPDNRGRHDGGRRTAARPGSDHPGGGARGGLGRGGQAGRHRAVGPGLVRRQAHAGAEGGRAGLGRDRRPERGDRHRRAARARPAVRCVRRHPGRALGHVRGPGRDRLRRGPARRPPPRPGPRHPFVSGPARWPGTAASARSASTPPPAAPPSTTTCSPSKPPSPSPSPASTSSSPLPVPLRARPSRSKRS